jgi:hypothetical protein
MLGSCRVWAFVTRTQQRRALGALGLAAAVAACAPEQVLSLEVVGPLELNPPQCEILRTGRASDAPILLDLLAVGADPAQGSPTLYAGLRADLRVEGESEPHVFLPTGARVQVVLPADAPALDFIAGDRGEIFPFSFAVPRFQPTPQVVVFLPLSTADINALAEDEAVQAVLPDADARLRFQIVLEVTGRAAPEDLFDDVGVTAPPVPISVELCRGCLVPTGCPNGLVSTGCLLGVDHPAVCR